MKIKNDDYEKIAKRVAEKVFQARFAVLKKGQMAFGDQMYEWFFTPEVELLVQALPSMWFTVKETVLAEIKNPGGYFHQHCFPLSRKRCFPLISAPVRMTAANDQALKFYQIERALSIESENYAYTVRKFLRQYATVARLQKHWPEGKEFYSYLLAVEPATQHMVIRPDFINTALGLM